MTKTHSERFLALDSLRGLFALSIVIWHYNNDLLPKHWHGHMWYDHLYIAVDFFFCLSGFVIANNYQERFDFSKSVVFVKKRLRRIYPLLLFSTIVYTLFRVTAFVLNPEALSDRTNELTLVQDFLNTFLLVNSTPILGITHGMNVPTWSISAEFICYVLFAIIATSQRRYVWWLCLMVCTTIIFHNIDAQHDSSSDFGFLRGIIGFGFGVSIQYIFSRFSFFYSRELSKFHNSLASLSIIVLIISAFCISNANQAEVIKILGIDFAFSITISVFVFMPKTWGRALNNPPLLWLGDVSYSVYLNHLIVLVIIEFAVTKISSPYIPTAILWITFLGSIALTLFYSKWTRENVEKRGSKLS